VYGVPNSDGSIPGDDYNLVLERHFASSTSSNRFVVLPSRSTVSKNILA